MATGTTVDELIVKIVADTKQLRKDLDQIKGKTRAAGAAGGAAFAGMGASLSKVKAGAVGAVAALAGFAVIGSQIAKVGSEFQDLKDSLDTVFGSMKAGDEAMQRILSFAQTTPFQVETATKAFISLKSAGIEPSNRMLQVFADTASTSTDQLGVFEALVRTVQRSASGGLGLEELNMIMDRGIDVLGILNTELGLTKNEIADFGATAEGAKLITDALINGLESKFGGAMETKMDNLSTATSNMQIAFKTLGDEIFKSGMGQFLTDMANALGRMAANIAKAKAVAGGRATAIELVQPEFTPRKSEMERRILEAETENLKRITDRQKELVELNKSLNLQIASVLKDSRNKAFKDTPISELLTADLSDATPALRDLVKQLKAHNGEFTILMDLNKDIIEVQKQRKNVDTEVNDASKEDLMLMGKRQRAASLLASEIEKLTGDTELLDFASTNLNEIFEQNSETFRKLGVENATQLGEKLKEIRDAASDLAVTFDTELKQAVINQSNAFTTDFVNALMDGESALDSFKNFAKNMVSQIIAIFLQMAVVNEILNSIFKLNGTPNALPTFPKKAGGGTVQGRSPVIVGERGPELFIPNTGGTIMNNMNTRNAMGSGQPVIVNQSINFSTGVVPTVRAEVTRMLPQIADVTRGAVMESAMRGGAFRRALQGG